MDDTDKSPPLELLDRHAETATSIPLPRPAGKYQLYNESGLTTGHNWDFVDDPRFIKAFKDSQGAGRLPKWRMHIGLQAAWHAAKFPGDFVECGVNRGMLSLAILHYIPWATLNKHYWLLDTWDGIDERYISDEERAAGIMEQSRAQKERGQYLCDENWVRNRFKNFDRVEIVKGAVPDTLSEVTCDQVCFLHLDMNCAPPEVAAANYFWDKMPTGGVILLDDYAYRGHTPQFKAMNAWADTKDARIFSIPTGQGLLIKT